MQLDFKIVKIGPRRYRFISNYFGSGIIYYWDFLGKTIYSSKSEIEYNFDLDGNYKVVHSIAIKGENFVVFINSTSKVLSLEKESQVKQEENAGGCGFSILLFVLIFLISLTLDLASILSFIPSFCLNLGIIIILKLVFLLFEREK